MNTKTKSPLKDKPLRYVAQSGDEAIDDLLNDKLFFYYSVVVIMGMVVGYEWYKVLPSVQRFVTPKGNDWLGSILHNLKFS